MNLKLVQVIYNNRIVKDKNGVERKQKMFFIESENGKRVAVKPLFDEGYAYFDAYCTIEFNDSMPKPKEEKK